MATTEPRKTVELPRQLITESLEAQPGILGGIYALAFQIAKSGGVPLALNTADELEQQLLAELDPAVAEALTQGEDVTYDSGQVVTYINNFELAQFSGLVLFSGADEERIKLLRSMTRGTALVVPQTEAQLAALKSEFPYAALAKIQPASNTPKLSDAQVESLQWFESRYDCLADGHLSPWSALVELGAGEPQVCRYCGKTSADVTFSNVSHAFPEQIGNKKLVDLRECDVCNTHFATTADDHFAKWTLANRAVGRIKGKKKVPSYESNGFRIDHKQGDLNIRVRDGDPRVKLDPEGKHLQMVFQRQPYVPMGVFKCFVKMALAVLPEPEASECQHLKGWLLQPTHSYESFPFKPLMVYTQLVPGRLPNDKVTYILLRRKAGVTGCPYLFFVVQYSNYVHQIALPMPAQDMTDVEATLQLRYFPHPWDTPEHKQAYGDTTLQQEDLSSPEIKRGDAYPMRFGFEELREIPVPTTLPAAATVEKPQS
ncbi:HNH endonuclease [Burkholderia sp. MR1-5-21]